MLAPVIGPMKKTGVEPMDAPALELMNAPVVALEMVTPAVAKADLIGWRFYQQFVLLNDASGRSITLPTFASREKHHSTAQLRSC